LTIKVSWNLWQMWKEKQKKNLTEDPKLSYEIVSDFLTIT